MSRHLIPCFLAFLLVSASAALCSAQGPLTREAVALAQAERYEEAEVVMLQALNTKESMDPTCWYVHAFIQKSLFVIRDGRHPNSEARSAATDAAIECARRNPEPKLEDELIALLSYLADTHFEDAGDAVRSSQPGKAEVARSHLKSYSDIQNFLNPHWDAEPDEVWLDQLLGEHAFVQAEQAEQKGAGPWFNWGRACYERAAARKPDRFRSLYNLAIHTYNQGVRQFKASEEDLDAVDSALKQAAILWNLAAEGLEQAISENAERASGYEALAVVSEALLNQGRVEWCKAHLVEMGVD
ncbi:MAG: hypothetical protein CL849_02050 [Crocinitomicaceae bacterium]|nr:hypothetical protein [Crocinitomicaceae bacterium]